MPDSNSSDFASKSKEISDSTSHPLPSPVQERGFFAGILEIPRDRSPWYIILLLIVIAYLFSYWVRLEWIEFAQTSYLDEKGEQVFAHPEMVRDGVALPNTHDSFYFGSIVQKASFGMHQDNHLIPGVYVNGMITALPYWILKFFPDLTIEQLLLWLPVYVSGLVCIPLVLIGRLYGASGWGFFAACLAGVTHSYYNRTLAGYYDTDMFSITSPAFSMFFLLAASRKESVGYLWAATVSLLVGAFFYTSLQAITCSLALVFLGYRTILFAMEFWFLEQKRLFWQLRSFSFTVASIFCMAWVLYADTWFLGRILEVNFLKSLSSLLVPTFIFFLFYFLKKRSNNAGKLEASYKALSSVSLVLMLLLAIGIPPFLAVGPFSGVWSKVTGKLQSYSAISQSNSFKSGEHRYSMKFLDVTTTIREASEVPKRTVLNRILSDIPSCNCPRCLAGKDRDEVFLFPTAILGFLGLFMLILRHWEFCLGLPFAAIAYYCFKGSVGLRFTVHAGNIASIGITFLLLLVLWSLVRMFLAKKMASDGEGKHILKFATWGTLLFALPIIIFLASPNVKHAQNYHSHVVYPSKTIEVLEELDKASEPDDFVVTWWDYGSGCWYYGGLRSFTSPAHQTYDNYLTSEILRSDSPLQAARLARLKTETFVDLQRKAESGDREYKTAVRSIFKDGQSNSEFYLGLLNDLGNATYDLPSKSRDMFLFLPYEILRIFPTILSFSSRNLYFPKNPSDTGQKYPPMTILRNARREGSSIIFDGGFRLNRRGELMVAGANSGKIPYNSFLQTQGDGNRPQRIENLAFEGLSIRLTGSPSATYQLLYVSETRELVILSAATARSTFARRFLLDRFDLTAYKHPLFEKGANPVRQPFMVQAEWVNGNSSNLTLYMRGNNKIEVDLQKNLAKIIFSGRAEKPVPFAFHRRLHDEKTGKIMKIPSKNVPNARYHLIQSNLPVFISGSSYEVPEGGKSVSEVARSFGVKPKLLASVYDEEENFLFEEGERLEIPARGYQMRQAWFFMDEEAFNSVLIQGFLMEGLPNEIFEKVYSTAWGKVYKIKQ